MQSLRALLPRAIVQEIRIMTRYGCPPSLRASG
jgi:hypothetical protein